MFIKDKTLKDTISFILADFKRQAKNQLDVDAIYQDAKSQLAGLSKLLIGRKEHSYTEAALTDLKKLYEKTKAKAA